MTHYYPLSRSIGMLIMGVLGLFISVCLIKFLISFLLVVMSVVALYIGIYGLAKRKKEPMIYDDKVLTFYRKGKLEEVRGDSIEKIFYNTKGIDKRVTILTQDRKEVNIPVVYGLAELVRKLNKNLGLAQK